MRQFPKALYLWAVVLVVAAVTATAGILYFDSKPGLPSPAQPPLVIHSDIAILQSQPPLPNQRTTSEAPNDCSAVFTDLRAALLHPTAVCTLLLDDQGLRQLPPEIGLLNNLVTLSVKRNQLHSLPSQ